MRRTYEADLGEGLVHMFTALLLEDPFEEVDIDEDVGDSILVQHGHACACDEILCT